MLFAWRPELLQAGQKQQDVGVSVSAKPWEEAQRLFHSNPHWLGGDGASSVDLDGERVLWLFGDSFINEGDSKSRFDAALVRNSIAVQSGRNPAKAAMRFFWRIRKGKPASYFQEEGKEWFWPGSGATMKSTLIIFLVKVRESKGELGFEPSGWKAVLIAETGKDPNRWNARYLPCPPSRRILVGSSSTLIVDGYLYAFGTDWKDNSVYLVRWPLRDACKGDLSQPRWWMGGIDKWMEGKPSEPKPVPVFTGGQVEFSVHYEPRIKRFLQIQTLSLQNPCLAVRSSSGLTGPWTLPVCFYQPPEKSLPGMLIYAGKAHKVFKGADLAFTYAVNTTDKKKFLDDMAVYYPVVLKGKVSMTGRGP